eukprot:gene9515-9595_t
MRRHLLTLAGVTASILASSIFFAAAPASAETSDGFFSKPLVTYGPESQPQSSPIARETVAYDGPYAPGTITALQASSP